jgi:hypothetical protein
MSEYGPTGSGYGEVKIDSIRDNPVDGGDIGRVLPRQVSTGSTRGTQTVGYGDTKIDGSNNVITVGSSIVVDGSASLITVTNSDKSKIGMGRIPNTSQFGFFATNNAGVVIMSIVAGTLIMNDTTTDRVLIGKDPGGF